VYVLLNKVILVGRLTKDPELRYTPANGVAVATFTVAVNRPFANQQGERETDFIPVVVWRKQAENCANYLNKGSLVAVDGRIQIRSYEDREGQRRWVTEIVADNVQFLSKKGENSPQGGKESYDGFKGDEVSIAEDDVPF